MQSINTHTLISTCDFYANHHYKRPTQAVFSFQKLPGASQWPYSCQLHPPRHPYTLCLPTHRHALLNPRPPLWHQAFASKFSAVCALNRPYQEHTILEGVTVTKYTEWKITGFFINTWIIQRHFKGNCWKASSRGL